MPKENIGNNTIKDIVREKRKVITFLHIMTTTIGFNRFSYLLEIELLLTLLTSMGNPNRHRKL